MRVEWHYTDDLVFGNTLEVRYETKDLSGDVPHECEMS